MRRTEIAAIILLVFLLATTAGMPQSTGQTQPSDVVSKSTKAIGYPVGGGTTRVDLKGTSLMPQASGEAKIEAKKGITRIEVKVMGLGQPSKLGTEFLTYVLWVVSPDGRTGNIGELLINNIGVGKLQATTQLQTFSLIVTAEPYFAVQQPSELVILENEVRPDTKGKIFDVSDYKLMKRGQYQKMGNPLARLIGSILHFFLFTKSSVNSFKMAIIESISIFSTSFSHSGNTGEVPRFAFTLVLKP